MSPGMAAVCGVRVGWRLREEVGRTFEYCLDAGDVESVCQ
jgi:hypothetical protein